MAARPHASALTGGLECIRRGTGDCCYTKVQPSVELAARKASPCAWPEAFNFAVSGSCIALPIFSCVGQCTMDLARANAMDTPKRPDRDALAVSVASPSTKEGRAVGAIAMHSNVEVCGGQRDRSVQHGARCPSAPLPG
jgi:hypothetical protein